MLSELIEAWTTPASAAARRLGYVHEIVAIGARARRQRAAWEAHLARTRAFVERAAPGGGKVVVLGSGRLLDLPLEALCGRYARVVLVDWVHPRSARRAAARHPNVALVEADVTGCLAELRADRPLPAVPEPATLPGEVADADLVVSLNLASQLPILPLQSLAAWGVPEPRAQTFAQSLVRAHLDALATCPGRAVVVTDVERRATETQAGGAVVHSAESSVCGLGLPPPTESWTWSLAPAGEIAPNLAMELLVHAYADWAKARRGGI